MQKIFQHRKKSYELNMHFIFKNDMAEILGRMAEMSDPMAIGFTYQNLKRLLIHEIPSVNLK